MLLDFLKIKNIIKESNLTNILFILSGISVGILAIYSFYPYIPREGDLMGCWYPYVLNWLNNGLGDAIKHTDAPGKFPTHAILIISSLKLTRLPLLEALQYVRLFTGMISIIGFFLILKKMNFTNIWALTISAILNLHPVYYGTLRMNVQDASKPGFFMLAIYFLFSFMEKHKNTHKKIFYLIGYIITACLLAMVRSVDIIPLFTFLIFWSFHEYYNNSDFKVKTFINDSKTVIVLISIPIFLLIGLLLYGKLVVHHWGFSNGGKPQPWIWLYIKTLSENWHSNIHGYKIFSHAVFWFLNNIINKLSYFTNDFIFMDGYLKIIGAYRLVKNLEIPGSSLWMQFLNGSIGIGIFVCVIFKIKKDLFCRQIWTVFLYSGLSGWFFWTFLLNHYEPRYWSLVFICWVIGLLGPYLKNAIKENQKASSFFVTIVFLASLNCFSFYKLTSQEIPQSNRYLANAIKWQEMAAEACKKNEDIIWTIPFNYWYWSSFRYFVEQKCSRIEIVCVTGNEVFCKKPTNPNHKKIVEFPIEGEDTGIIGFN